jgi:hypothetical protein
MSYIILRGRWCDIIVLNVHAPTNDKINDTKDRFYEELEHVFNKHTKYHTKKIFRRFPNIHIGRYRGHTRQRNSVGHSKETGIHAQKQEIKALKEWIFMGP